MVVMLRKMGNFLYVPIERQKAINELVNYPADIYMIKVNKRNTRTR